MMSLGDLGPISSSSAQTLLITELLILPVRVCAPFGLSNLIFCGRTLEREKVVCGLRVGVPPGT